MSYLDSASLLMIPSGYKEDKIFTQLPEDGSGDLTFTRASDGTRVNSEGYIERVPWNLLQYSNTFSNGAWTKLRSNVVSGQTDKDGGTNAWKFNDSTDTATHRLDFVLTLTDNAPYTFSCYAKAGEHNTLGVEIGGFSVGGNYVLFHLNNGTKTESGTVISSSITSVGNGWYYCVISTNAGAADRLCTQVQTDSTGSYTGTGGNGIYIQNAQLVEGPTAKPYIATTTRQDVPRLDHSNGCPCLLLEPQRTNLVTYSEQFDNAAWTKINATITANSTTAPDGTNTADFITSTGTNETGVYRIISVSGTNTWSVYAKKGTGRYLLINTQTPVIAAKFDLQEGIIVGTPSTGALPSIESAGNGWYKCIITSSTSTNRFTIFITNNTTTTDWSSTVGLNYYIWGAQLEQSSYATSYIPTTSAAVTRLKETLFLQTIPENTTSCTILLDTAKLANTNATFILRNSSNALAYAYYFYSGGFDVYNGSAFIVNRTTESNAGKIAIVHTPSSVKVFINGSDRTKAGAAPSTNTPQRVYFDTQDTGDRFCNINKLQYFPTALTDAQCIELTTL